MTRIVVCDVEAAVETALLQAGHPVLRVTLPRGPLAALLPSGARRAAEAFGADCLMAGAETPQGVGLAGQLGVRHVVAPTDAAFLLDRALPGPFFVDRPVVIGAAETMEVPVDIAVIGAAAGEQVAACMAAGCAIVAPDDVRWRMLLGEAALFHDAALPGAREAAVARIEDDPALRRRLGAAARGAFEARHRAAREALLKAAG